MDHKNFENETFDILPETISCSNFRNCVFNASAKFDRCNIMKSTFTKNQHFLKSNVLGCVGTDGSIFEQSNNDPDWKEDEDEPNEAVEVEVDA